MYVCESEIWRILIWRLQWQTAKSPNLILRQIFRLYGNCIICPQLTAAISQEGRCSSELVDLEFSIAYVIFLNP